MYLFRLVVAALYVASAYGADEKSSNRSRLPLSIVTDNLYGDVVQKSPTSVSELSANKNLELFELSSGANTNSIVPNSITGSALSVVRSLKELKQSNQEEIYKKSLEDSTQRNTKKIYHVSVFSMMENKSKFFGNVENVPNIVSLALKNKTSEQQDYMTSHFIQIVNYLQEKRLDCGSDLPEYVKIDEDQAVFIFKSVSKLFDIKNIELTNSKQRFIDLNYTNKNINVAIILHNIFVCFYQKKLLPDARVADINLILIEAINITKQYFYFSGKINDLVKIEKKRSETTNNRFKNRYFITLLSKLELVDSFTNSSSIDHELQKKVFGYLSIKTIEDFQSLCLEEIVTPIENEDSKKEPQLSENY